MSKPVSIPPFTHLFDCRVNCVKSFMTGCVLTKTKREETFRRTSFGYRIKGHLSHFLLFQCSLVHFRANADYYSSVSDPIDLTQIQQKIHANEYTSFEQFLEDIELLINNAKNFYRVNTTVRLLPYQTDILLYRKTPLNGKMLMNYRNIFTRKPNPKPLILITSKSSSPLFTMLKSTIDRSRTSSSFYHHEK
jgi:hypothetical protein